MSRSAPHTESHRLGGTATPCWYFGKAPLAGVAKPGEFTRLCPSDCERLEAAYLALGSPSRTSPPGEPPPTPVARHAVPGVCVRSAMWEADAALRWLAPCYPTDAPGGPLPPLALVRSTWFVEQAAGAAGTRSRDLLPVSERLADQLGKAAATAPWTAADRASREVRFGGPGLPPGLRAVFVSESEHWLVSDTLSSKLTASLPTLGRGSKESGAGGSGGSPDAGPSGGGGGSTERAPVAGAQRLRRSFQESLAAPLAEDEREDAVVFAQGEVTHLVLTTHGIGHSLESVEHCSSASFFRKNLRRQQRHLTSLGPGGGVANTCVAVLPVQWRKGLALAGDEGALDALIPDAATLRQMRVVLNALVSDVLCYNAAGGDGHLAMAEAMASSMNEVVERFRARHPTFDGPISLVAHSLGSVLAFDLLTRQPSQPPSPSPEQEQPTAREAQLLSQLAAMRSALERADPSAAAAIAAHPSSPPRPPTPRPPQGLAFPVDTLVMLGSPLGLFQALRGRGDFRAAAERMRCRRLVNLMHPYDPVGYRVEPLLFLEKGQPFPVKPADSPVARERRLHAAASDLASAAADKAASVSSALRSFTFSNVLRDKIANAVAGAAAALPQQAPPPPPPPPQPLPSSPCEAPAGVADADIERLLTQMSGGAEAAAAAGEGWDSGSGRLDFQLHTADLNPFYSVLTAHTSYWQCHDTALFVLRACGPTITPASPPRNGGGGGGPAP